MKKHDALFILMTLTSLLLLGLITLDNVRIGLRGTTAQPDKKEMAESSTQTQTLQKEFLDKGLSLHEGKYWSTP